MLEHIEYLPLPNSDMSVADALMYAAEGHEPAAAALADVGLSYADGLLTFDINHRQLRLMFLLGLMKEPGATSIPGVSISIPLKLN